MPKLWTFGDSFTKGYGMNGEVPGYTNANPNLTWTNLLSNTLNYELKDFSKSGATNEFILTELIEVLPNFHKDDIVIIQSSTINRYEFPFYYKNNSKKEIKNGCTFFLTKLDEFSYDFINKNYKSYDNDTISKLEYNASIDFMKYLLTSSFYYKRSTMNLINIAKYLNEANIVKNVIFWNLESIRTDKISNKKPLLFNIFDEYSFMSKFYLNHIIQNDTDSFDWGWFTLFYELNLTIWHDSNKAIDDLHLSDKGHFWFTNFILDKLSTNKRVQYKNII